MRNQIFTTARGLKELPAKLGSELTPAEQRHVLAAFVHRFTGDHKPRWARKEWKDGRPYPVQYANDQEWLAHTWFAVTPGGALSESVGSCYSPSPTWPENPEMRGNHGAQFVKSSTR